MVARRVISLSAVDNEGSGFWDIKLLLVSLLTGRVLKTMRVSQGGVPETVPESQVYAGSWQIVCQSVVVGLVDVHCGMEENKRAEGVLC